MILATDVDKFVKILRNLFVLSRTLMSLLHIHRRETIRQMQSSVTANSSMPLRQIYDRVISNRLDEM